MGSHLSHFLVTFAGANVNELQKQNNRFAAENTRLEGQVSEYVIFFLDILEQVGKILPLVEHFDSLKVQESRLEQITAEQGSNVQHLVSLVKDNKEIQTQMKVSFRFPSVYFLLFIRDLSHSILT